MRSDDRSWGQRLLAPVAEVERDEVAGVLLLSLLMFLILGAYYFLKTAREVFILSEGGAEVKSYSAAGQAVLLLFLVPAYGAVASRVNRLRLVQGVTLFFALHLALFLAALGAGLRVGIVYFLWIGIFNVVVIAQFWAFANDLFTQDQGKRLFPVIGVGASLGAWVGSIRAGTLIHEFGAPRLLIAGATTLVVCTMLTGVINRVVTKSERKAPAADAPLGRQGGFGLIATDRYLTLIAALMVLLNIVNTTGEYLFGRYVVETAQALHGSGPEGEAARQVFIGETYSGLYGTVNLVGFVLQMFVVSRVFKFLGVGRSLFIHPLVSLSGYLMLMVAPSLTAMRWLKVADNGIDYSLGNTTKQALWLPTSREAKYKAKQAVDSFFVRTGDVIQALIVFAGERLALVVPAFAAINVALVGVWLGVVVLLNRQLRAKAAESGLAEL